ncbi:hypothetical protein QVD17_18137 [Tagetes erecta]|uniref:Uncharacterized protein n=1 Tax=Tagetes erecta TaxID=13708 RepID=A0AAD8KHE2_TARER|nr:hypothetical protein QVD17_18137 [Tagetes erecta]
MSQEAIRQHGDGAAWQGSKGSHLEQRKGTIVVTRHDDNFGAERSSTPSRSMVSWQGYHADAETIPPPYKELLSKLVRQSNNLLH